MSITKSYLQGISRAARRPRMIGVLWLFNVILAIPAYVLLKTYLSGTIGPSLAASGLVKRLDMSVIIEVLTSSGVALGGLMTAIIVLLVLHFLVSIFCFGGILNGLVSAGGKTSFASSFFGGGGKFYGRFFRLTIYSLALWAPAAVLVLLVNAALSPLSANPVREQLGFVLNLVQVALVLLLAYGIKMIMDYARIIIAAGDSREVLRMLLQAAGLVLRRPAQPVGLYGLLSLTGWAAFLVYIGIQSLYVRQSVGAIIIGFVIAQVFMASRAWLKIAFQAGQIDLLASLVKRREPQITKAASAAEGSGVSGGEAGPAAMEGPGS